MVFVVNFHEIQGQSQFHKDIMHCFRSDMPVFLSTSGFNDDLSSLNKDCPTTYIKYIAGKEERQVANHINELYRFGHLSMLLFLDDGHNRLLDMLINELKLFNKGVTGIIPKSDLDDKMKHAFRLDTKLYLYDHFENKTMLQEIYKAKGNSIINTIGTCRENLGLSVPLPNMWDRRKNFGGMTIRVATLSLPILHELYYDESGKYITGGDGFLIQPLKILAEELNFTIKFIQSVDGKWGGVDINGTWDGLIGMLVRGEVDVAAAILSQTKERHKVTTFSTQLLEGDITLMSQRSTERESRFWIYLQIFPMSVWLLCGVMVGSIAVGFTTINISGINYLHDTYDPEKFNLLNGFGLALSFFRQIYYEVNVQSISTRMFFIISAVSTYIIFVHYITYLTAVSTSGTEESSIHSFEDVINGGYKVLVVENTAEHRVLREAKPGSYMHQVYHKSMIGNPNVFLKSYEEVKENIDTHKDTQEILFFGPSINSALYDKLESFKIQGIMINGVNFCS